MDALLAGQGGGQNRAQTRARVSDWQFRRNHGATCVDNLALVCWGCHRKVHHHGWRMVRDGRRWRLVAPWHADGERGLRQPAHCGRRPR